MGKSGRSSGGGEKVGMQGAGTVEVGTERNEKEAVVVSKKVETKNSKEVGTESTKDVGAGKTRWKEK